MKSIIIPDDFVATNNVIQRCISVPSIKKFSMVQTCIPLAELHRLGRAAIYRSCIAIHSYSCTPHTPTLQIRKLHVSYHWRKEIRAMNTEFGCWFFLFRSCKWGTTAFERKKKPYWEKRNFDCVNILQGEKGERREKRRKSINKLRRVVVVGEVGRSVGLDEEGKQAFLPNRSRTFNP